MLVVADASPIHVLIRIEYVDVLPALFGTIIVPGAVAEELRSAKYEAVQRFMATTPKWLDVRDPLVIEPISTIHSGEEAAIQFGA
jgi:uncharacterized protein